MGEVYRAVDARLNRKVALKVLPSGLATDSERLARFSQEARTTALLNHPNIVTVYDVGAYEGVPFVVSELLDGQTLRARMKDGALPMRVALTYALEIARGLTAAHDLGVVHRDLKPENIFITRDERVKILDFGLAKCRDRLLTSPDSESSVSTQSGMLLGTVGYMSPEQVSGGRTDQRSDIFSLGVILYETLAGVAPFHTGSSVETLYAIMKTEPAPLRARADQIPLELVSVVGHCLEKDPHSRFQSARDLAFNLELVLWVADRDRTTPLWRGAARPKRARLAALLSLV
jgi:eukaryotic-like serine/threonine-protein kinase